VSAATVELGRRGLVAPADGWFDSTVSGDELIDRLVDLRREHLAARLADCTPEEREEFAHVLSRLANDLLHEPPVEVRK